ncbi:NAD(P)-dependent oxidoreductase [Maricaulaceae bacterium NA33B04]|nr:NAD(P)-dependent oxidoreductase [Maricaulaceae bacterium NA33B04]
MSDLLPLLARALAEAGSVGFGRVVGARRAQADLAIPCSAARLIQQLAPPKVIKALPRTAVDAAEAEEEAAWRINAEAAVAALHLGAHFVQASTDYVFGGDPNTS